MEVGRLVEQVRVCEGVLAEERRGHTHTRSEATRLSQELEDLRESLLREKTNALEVQQVSHVNNQDVLRLSIIISERSTFYQIILSK